MYAVKNLDGEILGGKVEKVSDVQLSQIFYLCVFYTSKLGALKNVRGFFKQNLVSLGVKYILSI